EFAATPRAEAGHPATDTWHEAGEAPLERVQPIGLQRVEAALRDDVRDLPIRVAHEEHDPSPRRDAEERRLRVASLAWHAEPEHVDRRAEVDRLEPRLRAHDRLAPVRAHHTRRADLAEPAPRRASHATSGS